MINLINVHLNPLTYQSFLGSARAESLSPVSINIYKSHLYHQDTSMTVSHVDTHLS